MTVSAQDSVTVLVQFQPDLTPGSLLDTLVIIGDDLNNSELHIPLSGESVWPVLELSDEALSFGDVRVGVLETLQLSLSNTGSDTLFVDSIYVSDSLSGFSVALGEMNTSRSLMDRMALSKSPLGVTPSEKSRSRSRSRGGARSSSGDQSSGSSGTTTRTRSNTGSRSTTRTRSSTNHNTDHQTTRGSSRSGPTTPGNTAVDDSKESTQATTNSVLTISTEVMP